MRPIRLELSGFTAFRDQVVVDFEDVDFFALVGPTGSGKSSVVDAICFALYGCIPRYDDERLIAPAISQGLLETKVRLDFEVEGQAYVVVRAARRQGKGASTKEARLERGDDALAGTADEVTAAIQKLLGLPFDHFTKCVVLPQGDFARFLHDKPSKRQDLLVSLLNFGVYEWMGHRAGEIATLEHDRAKRITRELDEDLAFATAGALAEASGRVKQLETLKKVVDASQPKITELHALIEEKERAAQEAEQWATVLAALQPPDSLTTLARDLNAAQELVDDLRKQVTAANEALKASVASCRKLPDRGPLEVARAAHVRLVSLRKQSHDAEVAAEASRSVLQDAEAALITAEEDVKSARVCHEEAVRDERAHELARSLKKDEPCPVCGQNVSKVPKVSPAKGITEAAKLETLAIKRCDKTRDAHLKAANDHTAAANTCNELAKQLSEVEQAVASYPDAEAIEKLLADIRSADKDREDATALVTEVSEQLGVAESAIDDARAALDALRVTFEAQRDSVASLGPPASGRKNLGEDWMQLKNWAEQQQAVQTKRSEACKQKRSDLEATQSKILVQLDRECEAAGVLVTEGRHSDAVLTAVVTTRAEVSRIEEAITAAEELRQRLVAIAERRDVARAMARYLSSTGFEKWLINEALARLCEGATSVLHELSDGQYSLTIDDTNNFLVVDHRNADATRSAKTLSGGETFLASLSLALALSEHLAELAASGAARLDAIFLDEGFGTLDSETLEIVAAAVENLGAQGRMVGVVTHVRELADRVPIRFEVRKGPHTSTIDKVSA